MSKGLKRNYSVALIVPTDAIGLLIGKVEMDETTLFSIFNFDLWLART